MSATTLTALPKSREVEKGEVFYPESDGKPIAENTVQFNWIERIKGNIEALFADNPDVFVAADNLWYPVEGNPSISVAPDVYVAFGRPKGDRGSYKQWEEGGIAPQVVFEIWSPGNTPVEITGKYRFYNRYGVEEYYCYTALPNRREFAGWIRDIVTGQLEEIDMSQGVFVSPRLGIRFDTTSGELVIYHPNGEPFKSMVELNQERIEAQRRAEQESQRAESEKQRAEQAERESAVKDAEIARLREMLQAAGIGPTPTD
jgi:Uma2 family endonuclease